MQFGLVRSVRKVFLAKERGGGAQEDLVALDDASFDFEAESSYLLDALTTGRWSTASSAEDAARKERIRAQRKARAVAKKQARAAWGK
jgi:hypothetical protein